MNTHVLPPLPDAAAAPDPDALAVGERVWVSNPEGLLAACRIEGWGVIQGVSKDTATVLFDQAWVGHADPHRMWHVLVAACHREGPKGEPPEKGALFLGRRDTPAGLQDFWWLWDGHVCGMELGGPKKYTPQEVVRGNPPYYCWTDCYRAALAVARELGLVEAEQEPAPEPERDKFDLGDEVRLTDDFHGRITRLCADGRYDVVLAGMVIPSVHKDDLRLVKKADA